MYVQLCSWESHLDVSGSRLVAEEFVENSSWSRAVLRTLSATVVAAAAAQLLSSFVNPGSA